MSRRTPVYSDGAHDGQPALIGWIVWPASAELEIAEALRLFGEGHASEVTEGLLSSLPVTPRAAQKN